MPSFFVGSGHMPDDITAKAEQHEDGSFSLLIEQGARGQKRDIHLAGLSRADLERIEFAIRVALQDAAIVDEEDCLDLSMVPGGDYPFGRAEGE